MQCPSFTPLLVCTINVPTKRLLSINKYGTVKWNLFYAPHPCFGLQSFVCADAEVLYPGEQGWFLLARDAQQDRRLHPAPDQVQRPRARRLQRRSVHGLSAQPYHFLTWEAQQHDVISSLLRMYSSCVACWALSAFLCYHNDWYKIRSRFSDHFTHL